MKTSASKPVPDDDDDVETVPANILTWDNLPEKEFWLFEPTFDIFLRHGPFYDTGTETKAN